LELAIFNRFHAMRDAKRRRLMALRRTRSRVPPNRVSFDRSYRLPEIRTLPPSLDCARGRAIDVQAELAGHLRIVQRNYSTDRTIPRRGDGYR